ncbi:hypothetical protein L1987_19250 [Smallanthus sonchifolius]|uniref:Uncharacterized protein n=1 Tax=Smallanthus sonchifolius TaxID=185202 RepID=A0ACB9IPQ9_9ASTR|nr:hypothetical protein L1987_19250 [Smallanthus sonchifolius]
MLQDSLTKNVLVTGSQIDGLYFCGEASDVFKSVRGLLEAAVYIECESVGFLQPDIAFSFSAVASFILLVFKLGFHCIDELV